MQLWHLHKLNSFNIIYIVILRSVIVDNFQNGCLNAQTLSKLPIDGNHFLVWNKAMFVCLFSLTDWSVGYTVNVSKWPSWYSVMANLEAYPQVAYLVTSSCSFWFDLWENILKTLLMQQRSEGSASSSSAASTTCRIDNESVHFYIHF